MIYAKYCLLFIVFLMISVSGISQKSKLRIEGVVVDKELNESIPFVHVAIGDSKEGTITDSEGRFKITIDWVKQVELHFFHTSFQNKSWIVELPNVTSIIVVLDRKDYQTEEITIKASVKTLVNEIIPGKLQIQQKDILITPTLMGEPDLVRTLQLLPGIQSVNEGNSGIYVRGGSPGQNYIVFDDIELMNPSHLMGIYSVFNPLLVDKVDFYKGNAPVHQSSRIASSIIVNTLNNKVGDYNWSGNVGNISSNLTYQGLSPSKKWFTHVGFRRSYLEGIQWVAEQFIVEEDNYFTNNKFNFYDFNGKVGYQSGASGLYLSWYKGHDDFSYSNAGRAIAMNNNWGNEGMSLVWKYLFRPDFSMKNTISYSGYQSSLSINFLEQDLRFDTDYQHYQFKSDYLLQHNQHLVRLGLHSTLRNVSPQNIDLSLNANSGESFNTYQHVLFKVLLSDHFPVAERLDFYAGGALEYYIQRDKESLGLSDDEEYTSPIDDDELFLNGVFTFSYKLPFDDAIKGSYSYVTQNIHLTSIASIPLPSDVWMPATTAVPTEIGHQFTLGYFKDINRYGIQLGIEGYGKLLRNQLVLNVNVNGEELEDFEDSFFVGKGKALGVEVFVKKVGERFNTNLSYTLGYTKQKFDEINNGVWHDAKYDRRHDLNVLCSYKLNEKLDLGGVFIFATGNKATLPVGRYWMMGDIANDYEGVNNYRMPVYHRLDLSLNYHLSSNLFKESVLNLSFINVLNRSNPYFIYYHVDQGEGSYDLEIKAKQVSLFPILPSVSWKFKF